MKIRISSHSLVKPPDFILCIFPVAHWLESLWQTYFTYQDFAIKINFMKWWYKNMQLYLLVWKLLFPVSCHVLCRIPPYSSSFRWIILEVMGILTWIALRDWAWKRPRWQFGWEDLQHVGVASSLNLFIQLRSSQSSLFVGNWFHFLSACLCSLEGLTSSRRWLLDAG